MPTKRVDPLLQRIGVRLRKARTARGLSQEALAAAAGLDRSYVSGLERGEFNVSVLVLAKLAGAVGVRMTRLLDEDQ